MVVVNHPLPNLNTLDVEALKALVLAQHSELASRQSEIENLQLLLKLKRLQSGPRSERVERQIGQLELRLEDLETNQPAAEMAAIQPALCTRIEDGPAETGAPSFAGRVAARNKNLFPAAGTLSRLRR